MTMSVMSTELLPSSKIPHATTTWTDDDQIWVVALTLAETASSAGEVSIIATVCRAWRDHISSIKEELFGAILPRRFPLLRYLSFVLEPSQQVMRLGKEQRYRRHTRAQTELVPHTNEVWETLNGKRLMDPDMACTMELWLESEPVLFAALSSTARKQQDPDCSALTDLLKDMHSKEEAFLKEFIDKGARASDFQSSELASTYDAMNKHCGWDKLSVMIFASNGDEVVRLCRAAFLLSIHDRYLFGNSLEFPKLILSQDGMIGMPMQEDREMQVGVMVNDSAVGERISVQGLKNAQHHNGKEGTVKEFIANAGRFRVNLDTGETIAIQSSNLRLAQEARADLSLDDKQHIMRLKLSAFVNPIFMAEVLATLPNMSQETDIVDA